MYEETTQTENDVEPAFYLQNKTVQYNVFPLWIKDQKKILPTTSIHLLLNWLYKLVESLDRKERRNVLCIP